ncbi:MAG: DUF4157 domain-containing protein [Promethearchaeota archaeon]
MAQSRAKDIEEKEESRRHKKAPQPSHDQRKQLPEAEDSRAGQAGVVLNLQQTYGNRYMQRVMGKVQAKLIVNPPDDIYEKEADRVADAVTRAPAPGIQRQVGEEQETAIKRASGIQRQDEKPEEEEKSVQAKLSKGQPNIVSEDLEADINAARGGGQSLPSSLRDSLEPRLGHDFSHVHIHTDAKADKLSQQLGARAFTTGHDIFFREGAYQPGSDSGRGLIAHELTHVVQQGAARVSRQAETEQATAGSKEEVQKKMKDAVDKLKTKLEKKYVEEILRATAECQAQGMGESSYKWAMEEAVKAASAMLKRKTAAADVTPEQRDKMIKELLNAAADVMKLGGDDKAVETAMKKARGLAEAQLKAAAKNLKPGSTEAKAKDVANKAVLVQLLGGDATKAVEAVMKWEEEAGKEGKPGKVK